jgi:phage shock protein A
MEVCEGYIHSGKHERVVFHGDQCPLCTAVEKIADLESKAESLEKELSDSRNEAGELKQRVEELEKQINALDNEADYAAQRAADPL